MNTQQLLETTFKHWIESGIGTATIICALHNACVHGEAIGNAGENLTDDNLSRLFEGFDICLEAARDMEV